MNYYSMLSLVFFPTVGFFLLSIFSYCIFFYFILWCPILAFSKQEGNFCFNAFWTDQINWFLNQLICKQNTCFFLNNECDVSPWIQFDNANLNNHDSFLVVCFFQFETNKISLLLRFLEGKDEWMNAHLPVEIVLVKRTSNVLGDD